MTNLSALDALASGWDALAHGMAPVQSFVWAEACAEAFAGDGLRVLAVTSAGQLSAVAPFALANGRLELLGTLQLGEPTDVLARDEEAREDVLRRLSGLGTPIVVGRIYSDSPTITLLGRTLGRHAYVAVRPAGATPTIRLHAGWSDPERMLNARRRADLRRARRRAEQTGVVSVDVASPQPEEVATLLTEFYAVEAAGQKGRARTALLYRDAQRAFYARYAAAAASEGRLRLAFLRIDGRAAAAQLAVERADRYWLLKIGYDETFARCSPGNILLAETIRFAVGRDLDGFEFLGAADTWTRAWTTEERACVSVRTYPFVRAGARAAFGDARTFATRRVRRALRHAAAGAQRKRIQRGPTAS